MVAPTTIRINDDLMTRVSNYMLREKRGNRSEVLRILIESALDVAEGKGQEDERLIALGDLGQEQRQGIRAILDELEARDEPPEFPHGEFQNGHQWTREGGE